VFVVTTKTTANCTIFEKVFKRRHEELAILENKRLNLDAYKNGVRKARNMLDL